MDIFSLLCPVEKYTTSFYYTTHTLMLFAIEIHEKKQVEVISL